MTMLILELLHIPNVVKTKSQDAIACILIPRLPNFFFKICEKGGGGLEHEIT